MNRSPNVILITIDSLRRDHVGCLGYGKNVTPYIDSVARYGYKFKEAFSNSSWTLPSLKVLLTSTYALSGGWTPHIQPWNKTLAETLRNKGYRTAVFHSLAWITYLHKGYEFSVYLDTLKPSWKKNIGRILRKISFTRYFLPYIFFANAHEINSKAISWVARGSKTPFFLWVHYMEVHHPYINSISYTKRISTALMKANAEYKIRYKTNSVTHDDINFLIKAYDGAIEHVDGALSDFFQQLECMGISFDNTITIITSDHGEEFGEHGGYRHSYDRIGPIDNKYCLYDELLWVPLVIAGPWIGKNRTITSQVSLIDVLPTVLDLISIEKPRSVQGYSFIPLLNKAEDLSTRPVISETPLGNSADLSLYSVRMPPWKYITTLKSNMEILKEEIYDLRKDPMELKNLTDERPPVIRAFRDQLLSHVMKEKSGYHKTQDVFTEHEKKEIIDRLRYLGYIDS